LQGFLHTLSFVDASFAIEFCDAGGCGFGLGGDAGLGVGGLAVEEVCEFLGFGYAGADVCVGPVVVLEGFEVVVFALEEGLGGDLGIVFEQRLLVDVEVLLGEALVGEELELVFLLDGAVLRNDILVGGDALSILAFKDIRLAGLKALDMLARTL
jgi:hypothetical protein